MISRSFFALTLSLFAVPAFAMPSENPEDTLESIAVCMIVKKDPNGSSNIVYKPSDTNKNLFIVPLFQEIEPCNQALQSLKAQGVNSASFQVVALSLNDASTRIQNDIKNTPQLAGKKVVYPVVGNSKDRETAEALLSGEGYSPEDIKKSLNVPIFY